MRRLTRWVAVGLGVVVVLAIAAVIAFPRVGAWAVRTKGLGKLERRLGRDVEATKIKVGWGSLVVEGVQVAGLEGRAPLATIARIEAKFDPWKAMGGTLVVRDVKVTGPDIAVGRDQAGDDLRELMARFAEKNEGGKKGTSVDWDKVVVSGGKVVFDDRIGGAHATAVLTAEATRHGPARIVLTEVDVRSDLGPHAGARELTVTADLAKPRETVQVAIADGEASLWKGLSLTGIAGTVSPTGPKQAKIDLSGGWGGAPGRLWTAVGELDGEAQTGELHLEAEKFMLDRLAPILEGSPIQDPAKTSIQTKVDVSLVDKVVTVNGDLVVEGLTVFHPGLANDPLTDLRGGARIAARWDHRSRVLTLDALDMTFRGVAAQLTGAAALRGGAEDNGTPRAEPRVDARLVVPALPCQKIFESIPRALIPHLRGIEFKGQFSADVRASIDWADLDNLVLGGSVAIKKCLFKDVPDELKPERLLGEIDHVVEVEMDRWKAIKVGPSNPDFVPLYDISPYLVKSLLSTEDSGFYTHHGFIVPGMRTALARDLKEGYFKYGASSITMQLTKNLLLQREKTLARKLQELVLTHYLESTITKDRMLEIYLNIIEFGPWLYGIGPASMYYFGKHPRDLNPVEAAFFSSILPNPKKRHLQYCANELTRSGDAKVQRILKVVRERDRLTEEEYQLALRTPLIFARAADLDPKQCSKETQRVIDNARTTQSEANLAEEDRLGKKPHADEIDYDGYLKGRAGKNARERAKVREREREREKRSQR